MVYNLLLLPHKLIHVCAYMYVKLHNAPILVIIWRHFYQVTTLIRKPFHIWNLNIKCLSGFCFQSRIKDSSQFLEVPILADRDVGIILDSWLSLRGRSLSARQKQMVVKVFRECSLPLFLKLSFEEACRWKSYSLPDATVLQTTVRDSINALFSRVETMHGKVLVSRALGYLTTGASLNRHVFGYHFQCFQALPKYRILI